MTILSPTVDDTFTAVHKDQMGDFHEHLNRQNAEIKFTKELKENGKIPILDCLITRDNNRLRTKIYRINSHTYRHVLAIYHVKQRLSELLLYLYL